MAINTTNKKSKLAGMRMPGKEKDDLHMYGESDEMPEDDPELAKKEEEYGMDLDMDKEQGEDPEHVAKVLGDASAELKKASDEELLAEMKRRGLAAGEPDEDDMAADYNK